METYVDAIRKGAIPCVENAVTAMAEKENRRIVEEALALYKKAMAQLSLPTPDDKTLSDAHGVALEESVKYFVTRAIFDKNQLFQRELNVSVKLVVLAVVATNVHYIVINYYLKGAKR